MTGGRNVTITLGVEDWVEIVCTLDVKARKIADGGYGTEETPGEDKRWVADLLRIKNHIQSLLYLEAKQVGRAKITRHT